jgi:hypothetical protein
MAIVGRAVGRPEIDAAALEEGVDSRKQLDRTLGSPSGCL